MKKLFLKTFGCQMNFYDSRHMSNLLKPYGFAESYEIKEADLIILNTCHIRDKAAEKVYSDLGRIKKIFEKNDRKKPVIAVAGCVAQAEGKEIIKRSPWVDIVVGPQAYTDIPKLIDKLIDDKKITHLNFPEIPKFDNLCFKYENNKISEFVTIQEGCDKFCSFCVVPYTRGPEYSRSKESIIDEIKFMVTKGLKEVILLGQNVNAWKDSQVNHNFGLGHLIEEIASINEIISIRYTTSHPLDMDIDLIKAHKNVDKLMPYLHLPIQSGSDKILKKMNRRHTSKQYLKIIELVRKHCPDIAISSDFIIGHPGEDEEDHKKTLEIINEVKFSSSFSFIYSQRPGTKSSDMKDQIDKNIKKARLFEIQNLLKKYQFQFNKSFEDKKFPVLISNINKKNQLVGRSPYNQLVRIHENSLNKKSILSTFIGNKNEVRISKSNLNSLEGYIED